MEFGSCVATPNSYCFVYAACENVILDFGFTNINLGDDGEDGEDGPHKKKEEDMGSVDVDGLNREDLELLDQTCSKENVATLEGIRDCNAFCQHHLCCFSEDEEENCKEDHGDECEAYESCRVIADGPEEGNKNGGGGESGGGGSSITVSPEEVEKAVFSAVSVDLLFVIFIVLSCIVLLVVVCMFPSLSLTKPSLSFVSFPSISSISFTVLLWK